MNLQVATLTDPGRQRERNEDAMLAGAFDDGSWVVVVCDGMGGHDAGDVASKTACRRIYQEVNAALDEPDVAGVLEHALQAAHAEVAEEAAVLDNDMGTTAVVARVYPDRLVCGWVGDSRLYLFRDGAVVGATRDHTVIQQLIDAGELDAEGDHEDHPDAHALTQAIGGPGIPIQPSTAELELCPGDVVVLCSDGLHDLISPTETAAAITDQDAETLALQLVDEANRRGGHDNITVAVIRVADAQPARADPAPAPAPSTSRRTPREAPRRNGAGRVTVPDQPLGSGASTDHAIDKPSVAAQRTSRPLWPLAVMAVFGAAAMALLLLLVLLW